MSSFARSIQLSTHQLLDWSHCYLKPMTCRVTCYVAGRVFTADCIARNYQEAREVALAQHPNARIVSVTAVFS